MRDTGTPTYDGLPLDRYLSLFEMLNPMHRLWSDGRWNKLTVAHGCYWKKCTFCDITLDYIARYDPLAGRLCSSIASRRSSPRPARPAFTSSTRRRRPPGCARSPSACIARGVAITWWGNIRFEKTFTPELAELLARSGCVAVSGGLEVASDRLLELMKKGVTVAQVARVTRAFTDAGIMVHAYLMYGFPTETAAGDHRLARARAPALRRGLHAVGVLAPLRRHRAQPDRPAARAVRHPPAPERRRSRSRATSCPSTIRSGCDHERLGRGLRKALYNYMHGIGLDADVRTWFARRASARDGPRRRARRLPAPAVPRDLIRSALALACARALTSSALTRARGDPRLVGCPRRRAQARPPALALASWRSRRDGCATVAISHDFDRHGGLLALSHLRDRGRPPHGSTA